MERPSLLQSFTRFINPGLSFVIQDSPCIWCLTEGLQLSQTSMAKKVTPPQCAGGPPGTKQSMSQTHLISQQKMSWSVDTNVRRASNCSVIAPKSGKCKGMDGWMEVSALKLFLASISVRQLHLQSFRPSPGRRVLRHTTPKLTTIKCSRIGSSSNHAWKKMGWRIPSFHHHSITKFHRPLSGASAVVSSMPDSSNRGAKLVSFDVELSLSNTLVLELLSNLSTTTHSCKPFKTHEKNTEHLSTAGFTRCKGAILQHKPTQTHTNWHIGYHILRAQTWCLHKRRTRSKMPQQLMFEHLNFPTEGLPFTANHLASLPVPQGQPQPEASRPKAMYEMEVQTFGIANTAGTNFRHSYEMTTRHCISCERVEPLSSKKCF